MKVTLKTEVYRTYEVDTAALEGAAVNLQSREAVGDFIQDSLTDEGDRITLPWLSEIPGLSEGSRDVYEVEPDAR